MIALEFIQRRSERPLRKLRNMVKRSLEQHVTQRFDAIDKLFLSLRLKGLCEHAERRAKRKTLGKIVQNAIARRHAIVHCGDLNDHGHLCKISVSEIKTRLSNIKTFVEQCNAIIDARVG